VTAVSSAHPRRHLFWHPAGVHDRPPAPGPDPRNCRCTKRSDPRVAAGRRRAHRHETSPGEHGLAESMRTWFAARADVDQVRAALSHLRRRLPLEDRTRTSRRKLDRIAAPSLRGRRVGDSGVALRRRWSHLTSVACSCACLACRFGSWMNARIGDRPQPVRLPPVGRSESASATVGREGCHLGGRAVTRANAARQAGGSWWFGRWCL
jgi:hypothetical protein